MLSPTISDIAVIGAGVIGRSWAQVFIRAGCNTAIFDPDAAQLSHTLDWIREDLELNCREGSLDKPTLQARLHRLVAHKDLPNALAKAGYVQESGPEQMSAKKAIFAELDRHAKPGALLCSSTSGLNMTEIVAGLPGARRCVIAHPVNPPHIIPLVEVVPGKDTDPAVIPVVREFLESVGQMPVTLRALVPGFLLNRLQAAVFREAIHLVETGVADLQDVERVVSEGLGLRWALLGPFGVGDANADGGLGENFQRYRQTFLSLMNDLGPASKLPADLVEKLTNEMSQLNGATDRADIRRWRDRMVRKIRALKEADPHP
jgi:3-hydroxyacyl-CoA dehydrogenase